MKKLIYPIIIGTMALNLFSGCANRTKQDKLICGEIENIKKNQQKLEKRIEDLEVGFEYIIKLQDSRDYDNDVLESLGYMD